MSDIENRVKKIVVEHLGIDESKVVETASFIDDLGADSLDTVELVMAFEEEFDCEIPDDAAEKIQTVKDAIDFLKENSKEIHTPVPDCFLDGITRRTIIDIAKENNFKINERKIKLEELKDFDACFLTGTAAEVTPVSEIGNYKFKVTPSIGKFFDRYLDIVNRKVTV